MKGRPQIPEKERCFRTLSFKIKQDKYDAYMEKFKQSGFPKQVDFLLAAVLKSETKNGSKVTVQNIRSAEEIKSELRKIGTNINQVVKFMNTAGYAATDEEIRKQLQLLNAHLSEVESQMNRLNDYTQSF